MSLPRPSSPCSTTPARAREIGLAGQHYIAGVCGPELSRCQVEDAFSTAQELSGAATVLRRAPHMEPRQVRGPTTSLLAVLGPNHLFRRHMKARLRTLRNQLLPDASG